MRTLTFGYSPCPNDTFAFHALSHGLVETPVTIRPVLLDIEELNRRAHHGEFDLTKLSVGAFAGVGDRYRLLRSGAALGYGVGPLVVARSPRSLEAAVRGCVAIPGRETTAYRLLRTAAPAIAETVELRYDAILAAVRDGEVDAGEDLERAVGLRQLARGQRGLPAGSGLGEGDPGDLVGGPLGQPYRRHPHHVTGLDPRIDAGAAFVNPHFAAADDAVNMGLGHTLELAQQEVVQALAGRLGVDFDPFHLGCGGRRFAPYNVFH